MSFGSGEEAIDQPARSHRRAAMVEPAWVTKTRVAIGVMIVAALGVGAFVMKDTTLDPRAASASLPFAAVVARAPQDCTGPAGVRPGNRSTCSATQSDTAAATP